MVSLMLIALFFLTPAFAADLVHLTTPGATCLDGSQAAFYWRAGSPGNTTWVFMLEGGGLCSHKEDCLARATTRLGSSKNYAPTMTLPAFLSPDPVENPTWHQANAVFLKYCTGDLHAGRRNNASAATWGLRFAGQAVVAALVDELKASRGLDDASLVVFAGGSAGGMGVIFNVDRLPWPRTAAVLGMPIGGYIFDHAPFAGPGAGHDAETCGPRDFAHDAALFDPSAASAGPCFDAQQQAGRGGWNCFVPTTLYPYLTTPLLVLESQIDSVVMFGFSDLPMANNTAVQAYASEFWTNSTKLAKVVAASNKGDSIFSPNCFMHTGFARGSPTIGGADYYAVLERAARAVLSGRGAGGLTNIDDCAFSDAHSCGTNCPPFP